MKCEEVGEFISALCDGEKIPPQAAEHVGVCPSCRARLQQYLNMGAELRRVASLQSEKEITFRSWDKVQRVTPWWLKGRENMRIPRFAFALLLLTIVALSSGLVIVKARAHTEGKILLLAVKPSVGPLASQTLHCAVSLVDGNSASCEWLSPPQYMLGIRVLSYNGDQIELGVRAQFMSAPVPAGTYTASLQDLQRVPEQSYWFRPGEKLEIDTPQTGGLVLSGELADHMPVLLSSESDIQMDPKPGELRVISPLLLHGNKVVFDFFGGTVLGSSRVQMYIPGEGRWVLSLHPLEGAVEGSVKQSRISFALNGESYTFVMAAPVSRGEHVWIRHEPNYKPSDTRQQGFIGGINLSQPLKSPATD